jgi:hypothetical protein
VILKGTISLNCPFSPFASGSHEFSNFALPPLRCSAWAQAQATEANDHVLKLRDKISFSFNQVVCLGNYVRAMGKLLKKLNTFNDLMTKHYLSKQDCPSVHVSGRM